MAVSPVPAFFRTHPFWTGMIAILIVFLLLFDWNWFRQPLESYISEKSRRVFRISDLDVDIGLAPVIRMRDVVFGNTAWGKKQPMASIKRLEFSVSMRDLFDGKILVPRVALSDAEFLFERSKDGRRNWTLSDSSGKSPSKFRISTLSVDNGRLRYFDYGVLFELDVRASTFDPAAREKVKDADAKPVNSRYSTRYSFKGRYHDASFSGNALTGEILSFQESGILFPLKGNLQAGTTKVEVEGSIADAVRISGIDVSLHIAGETLANLYPFLLLPLPASPPYELHGHLVLKENRYTFDRMSGKIGSTDIYGKAAYIERSPRPLLTAELHSKRLDIADLGPLIGVKTEPAQGKPVVTQAETNSRQQAVAAEKNQNAGRILPAGTFEGSRLQAIDAEVSLESKQLKVPVALPFESINVSLKLHDAILKLEPLEFGFAGGKIVSQVMLDARKPVLKSSAQANFRRLRLDRLFPENPAVAKAAGTLGARMDIAGTGNSIADIAAQSNGTISAAVANGRVSNLLDAISGLNGGKAILLAIGGDRDIAVRCGGMAFDIADGQGSSSLFIVDTEETRITGEGGFDLERERLDLTIEPKPKKAGILSLRTPIRVTGSFRNPELSLEKGPLTLRAGAAIALAAVNPLAALLPLIETGSGEETDCEALFNSVGEARRQAREPAGKAGAAN